MASPTIIKDILEQMKRMLSLIVLSASLFGADWKFTITPIDTQASAPVVLRPFIAAPWEISIGVLAGSNIADAASSRGLYELNPVLGRGHFGARQLAIKSALVGGSIAFQRWSIARHPGRRRAFTILNFASSAGFAAIATRNWRGRN